MARRKYRHRRTRDIGTIIGAIVIVALFGFYRKYQVQIMDKLSDASLLISDKEQGTEISNAENVSSVSSVPDFSGNGYVIINDNNPDFNEVSASTYFEVSELDDLGRCSEAKAAVNIETLATEERGSIGMIKPSGWHTQRYDNIIADKYLYNRGHLIMFALYGNETNISENLITETRYANATTQLFFESQILDYIRENGATVEYHVKPDFRDNELVARGVELQALSSDGGLKLHVYVYNVQPGVSIDYATGDSYENQEIFVDGINSTVE